jgi:hypothetical protein
MSKQEIKQGTCWGDKYDMGTRFKYPRRQRADFPPLRTTFNFSLLGFGNDKRLRRGGACAGGAGASAEPRTETVFYIATAAAQHVMAAAEAAAAAAAAVVPPLRAMSGHLKRLGTRYYLYAKKYDQKYHGCRGRSCLPL